MLNITRFSILWWLTEFQICNYTSCTAEYHGHDIIGLTELLRNSKMNDTTNRGKAMEILSNPIKYRNRLLLDNGYPINKSMAFSLLRRLEVLYSFNKSILYCSNTHSTNLSYIKTLCTLNFILDLGTSN